MSKHFLNKTLLIFFSLFLLLANISCSSDDVQAVKPVDETIDKGHEEWTKVTFKFTLGHLHGTLFHANPSSPETKYFIGTQEITYQQNAKGDVIPSTTQPLRFIRGGHYSLEIVYYNKKGERMNKEFTTAEMSPIHQHFFLNKNVKDLKTNQNLGDHLNLFDYTYRDTDPEDQMYRISETAKLRPSNDPIGLKGYFYFTDKYKSFDLNILLVHVVKGTKLDENGKPFAFNNPSKRILGTQDLNLRIPAKIYTSMMEDDSEEEEKRFINDIAKEFNISYEEAYNDWEKSFDAPHDSSKYYM